MKLDILKKLIALANNNPNEHEANLAARRVCKALNEFTITEGLTRTTKPDFKSTRPASKPYYPFTDIYEEWFKRARQYERHNPFSQQDERDRQQYREGSWSTSKGTTNKEDEKYYRRKAERGYGTSIRKIKCKTCGKVKETIFTGLEQLFECNECQWTAYTRKFEERRCSACSTPIICQSTNYCARKGCAI